MTTEQNENKQDLEDIETPLEFTELKPDAEPAFDKEQHQKDVKNSKIPNQ